MAKQYLVSILLTVCDTKGNKVREETEYCGEFRTLAEARRIVKQAANATWE